jgi:hypothetical protein
LPEQAWDRIDKVSVKWNDEVVEKDGPKHIEYTKFLSMEVEKQGKPGLHALDVDRAISSAEVHTGYAGNAENGLRRTRGKMAISMDWV